MIVSDLLTLSLQMIDAVAAGETPAPEDYTLSQMFLNNLIGSWNAAVKKSLAANYDPSVYTFVPVAVTVNLTDVLSLPNGWPRAMGFNLAVDLLEPFGKPATQNLVMMAQSSKAEIITSPAGSPAPTV
jgi:hypothetical protein